MHIIHQGLEHPGQSSVVFLPMIDLYSGDKTCILSTLDFVCGIVLMLGGFHTFVNLLGAIGTLMKGTGLRNIMEVVCGSNAVQHMMTGKSVERAFRGHLLVDRCLNHLVVSELQEDDSQFELLVNQAGEMYSSMVMKETNLESAAASDMLIKIKEKGHEEGRP